MNTPPISPPPILHLPDELLIEIAAAKPQKSPTPERPTSEWVLSHVCRRFRRAVTGASTLWTRAFVDLCLDRSAEFFRIYLERSGACEIEVTLRAMDDLPGPKGLHYLSPHIGRIVRLTIVFGKQQAFDNILNSFQNVVVSSLEHLEIESSGHNYGFDAPLDLSPLDLSPLDTPSITSLTLTRCTPSYPPPQWMVALTHLRLKDNPYPARENSDIFRFITTQLPSLVYLYLDLTQATFGSGNGIVSQFLTHLDLYSYNPATNVAFNELAFFDTPNLAHPVSIALTEISSLFFLTPPAQRRGFLP